MEDLSIDIIYDPVSFCWTVPLKYSQVPIQFIDSVALEGDTKSV
jgi:hypothetical protein